MHPHTELLLSTFAYIARLSANEKFAYLLKEIGLKPEHIEFIRSLSLSDLSELAVNVGANVLNIRIDAEAMDSALLVLRRRQKDKAVIERLMKAGASYPLMFDLTGMDTRDYNSYRTLLQLGHLVGRCQKLSPQTQRAVFEAWFSRQDIPDMKLRLLDVHDKTGAPLRSVWPLVLQWERKGAKPKNETDRATAQP
jgi:hypothetical protein